MKVFKKLGQLIQEHLPAKSRIYFVYTHKNGFDRFNNGLKANTEISYWCFTELKKNFPSIRFLRCENEKLHRVRQVRPQDIVVGHIGPTFVEAAKRTRRLIAFNPWAGHEGRSKKDFNCAPHEDEMALFDQCASIVLLTSEYNKKKYCDQPSNFWYPYLQKFRQTKKVRIVHQPIDLKLFERIKWTYDTSNFLYVGNHAYMKCVDDSMALVQAVGRKLTLYGVEEEKLDNLNKSQVSMLSSQADFFIQPGLWEAQCVSILEAAARGFIPVVSPETGYPYDHPFLLRHKNFDYNMRILRNLLQTTPHERLQLANHLYEKLVVDVDHNNWLKLTDVLVEEVRHLYDQSIVI